MPITTTKDQAPIRAAKTKSAVKSRQKVDLVSLRDDINRTRHQADALDPKDVASLARSTQILHTLERDAYDLGAPGLKVNAVILLPVLSGDMGSWAKQAAGYFPPVEDAQSNRRVGVVEDDIQGAPDDADFEDLPAQVPVKRKPGRPKKVAT